MSNNQYKFSIFNIYIELSKDTIGIYNTLHDSAAVLDKESFNNFKVLDDEKLNALLNNRMIFADEFNEKRYFRYYLNKLKYSPRHATFVLSITSDCNLSCEYCFEGKNNISKNMSSDIALKSIQFITNSFEKHSSLKELYIAFFGGEPLLNKKIMSIICEEIFRQQNISKVTKFTLTSNLTTLTDDDIEILKHYSFTNVQVAIDGSKEFHDYRRKFKSGQGSFNVTVGNIIKLINNGINVMVFLNFDNENEQSYNELIPYIKKQLPFEKLVFVLNPITKSLCNSNCNISFMNKSQEKETFLKLYSKLKESGLTVQAFGQKDMLCIINTDVSCIIDPEGFIYKCGMMLGNLQYKVGSVSSNLPCNLFYELILEEPWKNCLETECAYLPVCGAGCRSLALVNEGSLKSVYCEKNEYFDTIYKETLKDHFNKLLKGGV